MLNSKSNEANIVAMRYGVRLRRRQAATALWQGQLPRQAAKWLLRF
ncbi:hypothetical protein ACUJ8P_10845 [Pasteurella testudinis]